MSDVTFGQYYPSNSFVHKCDPRAKILFLIAFIVSVFLADTFYALGACAFLFLLIVAFSGVPVKSLLRSLKAVLFLLVFTAILNIFFYQGETELKWWIFKTTKEGLIYSAFLAVRLFLLVLASSVLTLTTTPVALTDGIESLLTPLKWIRFPIPL